MPSPHHMESHQVSQIPPLDSYMFGSSIVLLKSKYPWFCPGCVWSGGGWGCGPTQLWGRRVE